ncbi:DNA-protecting protein DprA [Streptomyces lusitanus]|uniref:DNA-protecting protein DprA n=1 Tax=Streptomyces lusitanus TaxID=68232 RepID=UPI0021C0660A|nr:DNA-protecting protein DprA [Streptomyces lusitanus]
MEYSEVERLRFSLAAFAALGTPSKIDGRLREGGVAGLYALYERLSAHDRKEVDAKASVLAAKDIRVTFRGDDAYPDSLLYKQRSSAPILYHWGNSDLLHLDGVGMCGSRSASDLGLKAAEACGLEVSARQMSVISGYAKGVDTVTHLAALNSGGSTVIVLAEGFDHFRIKKNFRDSFDPDKVLVVSQFSPSQPWLAYAAMARNKVIFGLGRALVVVEAGEKGGTLAAGEGALRMGKPVFVLNFGSETPPGNKILLEKGGYPITSREQLGEILDKRPSPNRVTQQELPLGN